MTFVTQRDKFSQIKKSAFPGKCQLTEKNIDAHNQHKPAETLPQAAGGDSLGQNITNKNTSQRYGGNCCQ